MCVPTRVHSCGASRLSALVISHIVDRSINPIASVSARQCAHDALNDKVVLPATSINMARLVTLSLTHDDQVESLPSGTSFPSLPSAVSFRMTGGSCRAAVAGGQLASKSGSAAKLRRGANGLRLRTRTTMAIGKSRVHLFRPLLLRRRATPAPGVSREGTWRVFYRASSLFLMLDI